jgi:hypothetical protein
MNYSQSLANACLNLDFGHLALKNDGQRDCKTCSRIGLVTLAPSGLGSSILASSTSPVAEMFYGVGTDTKKRGSLRASPVNPIIQMVRSVDR